jgi:hypothetical protein
VERRFQGREHRGDGGFDRDRAREPPLTARPQVFLLALLGLGAQCEGNPNVSFEILLPGDVAGAAQWMEIGVLPGNCPSAGQLGDGVPPDGAVARVAFQKGDSSPPAIGDLPKGSYAFVAAARGTDCSVLAVGCTEVDLTEARDVSISLGDTTTPTGACAGGETCSAGRCAPTTTPGDPTLGVGCSMDLVAAGPLGDPLELSGTVVVTGPALAVTESGFLVAYREYDPIQGAARLTVAAVDSGGSLAIAPQTMLPAQCANQDESDGVGLDYLGGAGVLVSARPSCSSQPAGLDGWQVDSAGNVKNTAFTAQTDKPALARMHAVALTGASSGWLAFVDKGLASVVALSGLAPQGNPLKFGGASQTFAQVAATTQTLALMAGDGSKVTVQLGSSPVDGGPAASTLNGTWGALTAQSARAFVLTDGGSSGQPLAYSAFDVGGSGAATSANFAVPGQGPVAGGDAVLHGDRVMFAAEQLGAVSVAVYDHASTTPTPLRSLLLSGDVRIPAQTHVRNGLVSIAANDSRVLVAWVTAANLAPDDPLGGYALFACAP